MRFAAFLLALLPLAAAAAPPCWPNLTAPISVAVKDGSGIVGEGEVVYAASSIGLVWGYACTANSVPYKVVAGGPWTAFPADWLYVLDKALRGTEADRAALWDKYATGAIDARLATDVTAIKAQLPSLAWIVAPNGTYTTRPTYAWASGVRATTAAAERVNVGAACDPKVGVITTSSTGSFLGVLGRADRVALCRKQ